MSSIRCKSLQQPRSSGACVGTPSSATAGESSRDTASEQGSAAVEFGILLVPLLLLFAGVFVIGQGFFMRFVISSVAYDAARECTLKQTTTTDCVNAVIRGRLPNLGSLCDGGNLAVSVTANIYQEDSPVRAMRVETRCGLKGFSGRWLPGHVASFSRIRAVATMPY